ncbi:MAG TPA: FkbM family methyltransferase [Pyrinomonadaceae bacterium]|nr:FkbM family methyltransferase [Pyrinomonadaceae bacterium]
MSTLKQNLRRFAPPQVVHWGKCLVDADYRRQSQYLNQLRRYPRFQPVVTNIFGAPMEVPDAPSFLSTFRQIFDEKIYGFTAKTDRPYILDCGANIGLSVIYFKQLYPRCTILAFEADKAIFETLRRNVQSFGYENVEVVNRAVWNSETELNFTSDGGDGGRLSIPEDQPSQVVKTIRLRDYLDKHIDFLKLDIEGAEIAVLADCADRLSNVECLFVEYHSFAGQPQSLHVLTNVLAQAGFRLHIQAPMPAPQPFIKCQPVMGMDMQLNIFAFRPGA